MGTLGIIWNYVHTDSLSVLSCLLVLDLEMGGSWGIEYLGEACGIFQDKKKTIKKQLKLQLLDL